MVSAQRPLHVGAIVRRHITNSPPPFLCDAAFCKTLDHMALFYDPAAAMHTSDTGVEFRLGVKAEQMVATMMEYAKVEVAARDLQNLGITMGAEDPFRDCPACADCMLTTLQDGEQTVMRPLLMCLNPDTATHACPSLPCPWLPAGTPVPGSELAVSTDAVSKSCHYKSAGRSQAGIQPSTSTYMAGVAAQVILDHGSGILRSEAQERAAAAAQERAANEAALQSREADAAGGLPACTTALTCNREIASARGDVDRQGLVAVVCAHAFPGFNLVLGMPTHEQHSFYDYVLEELLRKRPDVKAIYLDLSCRYKQRFLRLLLRLQTEGRICVGPEDVALLLPWMHAFDHDMSCQQLNSGMYRVRTQQY